MKITREDVLRVAQLAYLQLTETEVELYRGQLDAILSYVDKLNEADVSGVEPMAQVFAGATLGASNEESSAAAAEAAQLETSTLRPDVVRPVHIADAVLKIAPDPSAPYFRVPKVIER